MHLLITIVEEQEQEEEEEEQGCHLRVEGAMSSNSSNAKAAFAINAPGAAAWLIKPTLSCILIGCIQQGSELEFAFQQQEGWLQSITGEQPFYA